MTRKLLTSLTAMVLAITMVISSVQQAEARRYRGGGGALAFGIAATVLGGIALSRAHRHDRYYGGYGGGYGYGYGPRYYRSGFYGRGYGWDDDYEYRSYRRSYYRPVYYYDRPYRHHRRHLRHHRHW